MECLLGSDTNQTSRSSNCRLANGSHQTKELQSHWIRVSSCEIEWPRINTHIPPASILLHMIVDV